MEASKLSIALDSAPRYITPGGMNSLQDTNTRR